MSAEAGKPSSPKPPRRAVVMDIIRRYLKKDRTPDWRKEIPAFHQLWKDYPSVPFWTKHTLPFELNSMFWFRTVEGAALLGIDYLVFHYNPETPAQSSSSQSDPLDIFPQTTYNTPTIPREPRRPKSVADFLS